MAIYTVQVLVVLTYKLLKLLFKDKIKPSKSIDKLSDIVFFTVILGLVIEGYFEFLISGYMNLVPRTESL